jgi:hypothetical protein
MRKLPRECHTRQDFEDKYKETLRIEQEMIKHYKPWWHAAGTRACVFEDGPHDEYISALLNASTVLPVK